MESIWDTMVQFGDSAEQFPESVANGPRCLAMRPLARPRTKPFPTVRKRPTRASWPVPASPARNRRRKKTPPERGIDTEIA